MVKNWLKIYWYHTMKHKMYFLLTVLGLAIGIAAVVLSSLYYLEESSYDQWNPNKDKVFVVASQLDKDNIWTKLPYPFKEKLMESSVIDDVLFLNDYYESGHFVIDGKIKAYNHLVEVESNFFDFFPYKVIKGDKQKPFTGPNTAVLRDKMATYLFGNIDPIGKVIEYDQKEYVVSGIYSLEEKRSSFQANILVNSQDDKLKENTNWGSYNATAWVKLKDASKKHEIEQFIQKLMIDNLYRKLAKGEGVTLEKYMANEKLETYSLHPLKGQRMLKNKMHNGTAERTANVQLLYIMLGLSTLILILSVLNYINMVTSQMIGRSKEIGTRKVVGASKQSLWLQSIVETSLTVVISFALAMVIIEFALPSVKVYLQTSIVFNLFHLLPYLVVLYVILVLMVGTIPALFMMSFKTLEVLKGKIDNTKKGLRLKRGMLVIQFVVACFFITGAIIVQKQLDYMLNKDLGFRGEQVVAVNYNGSIPWEQKRETYPSVKEDLLQIRGVLGVTTSSVIWGSGGSSSRLYYNQQSVQVQNGAMDYNFLEMMQIKLKEGRMLSSVYASDSISNVLVNEAVITELGMDNPIGKTIDWNKEKFTIVGVVENYHMYGLKTAYIPTIFMYYETIPWAGNTINFVLLKLDMKDVDYTMREVEKVWKKRGITNTSIDYEFVDSVFEKTFQSTKKERNVFLILNGIVIFIALFGLYSLASFTINNRLKEVAIRKVLGADSRDLIVNLSLQYILLALVGFVISVFPSYYLLNEWLKEYAFRIEIGLFPFVLCFGVILLLTTLIVWIKAWSASRLNILRYIKYE
ncbi:ABC transporter permease [Myroides pelagicus]|uniref:ABC transporter permease n=1 Tax=Myroides pelagicus TaxID=270914 RepID=UPI002DB74F1B|nr:ABC transporter permease [Myroides pelagicus]MEC4112649.1 ABC transporter permease [Myroides pelagicus]